MLDKQIKKMRKQKRKRNGRKRDQMHTRTKKKFSGLERVKLQIMAGPISFIISKLRIWKIGMACGSEYKMLFFPMRSFIAFSHHDFRGKVTQSLYETYNSKNVGNPGWYQKAKMCNFCLKPVFYFMENRCSKNALFKRFWSTETYTLSGIA